MHRVVLNERRRAFYLANQERLRAKQREYISLNADKKSTFAKLDAHRHFFRIRAGNLKLRHKDEAETATRAEIASLWRKQRGICPFSGIRLNRYNAQLDHIKPVIHGGSGKIENLRWVYRSVNYAKRELSDEQFIELCNMVVSHRKERL